MTNRLARTVSQVAKLPTPLRSPVLSRVLGNIVPFVGTAGLVVEELTEERAVISVANRRKVRNHIGGVHAAVMTAVAETATGFVVGMNVPDDKAPVVKHLGLEFKKRAKGGLRATAALTEEQRRMMRDLPKGEVEVEVRLEDEQGNEPLLATIVWAWTPKRREG